MLLSKTDQLLQEMDNLNNLQELAKDSQGFHKRASELKNINSLLINIAKVINLFRNHDFNLDIVSIFDDFVNSFNTLKEKWEEDQTTLLDANPFLRNNKLSSMVSEVENDLHNKWKKYIDDNKPSLNMEQLNILENIPDLAQMVKTLKEHLEEINKLKEDLPKSDDQFNLVITLTSNMNTIWSELSSQNISKEAMTFLKKAGSYEGIDLSEVTPEILLWLQEHKLTHLCQVRFKK